MTPSSTTSSFKDAQAERQAADPEFRPAQHRLRLLAARPRSAPTSGRFRKTCRRNRRTTSSDPEEKKKALKAIIADYNARFGTNHSISEFDLYYQDVQKRIKDQQFPNADLPKKGREKIDLTIVVDMLLTGFDSKYLNTLYVDKNLKHHGLIQAFSAAPTACSTPPSPTATSSTSATSRPPSMRPSRMFSGAKADRAREIWLVDKAPKVIEKLKAAVKKLDDFMKSQGLEARPEAVANLKGDDARAAFIKQFKEVQRLQTQLDQYTDLTEQEKQTIEQVLPEGAAQGLPRASTSKPPSACANSATSLATGEERPSDERRPARFRVRPLRLGPDRLRLHHGPDRPLHRAGPQEAEDEPRAAHRADRVGRQVHRRARGDHRLRPLAGGRQGAGREGRPRGLPAVQGRAGREGGGGRRRRSTAWRPRRCRRSSTASSSRR